MQNFKTLFACLCLAITLASHSYAQEQSIIISYIQKYKDIAVLEMQRTGVPASIKLAQGIHETMAGTSVLVTKSNNHFGIKCKSNWTGPSVSHDDDARGECFRKYESPMDSYRDHSNFLKNSNRYASLFQLDPLDYSGWAYGLKKAGYATNPKYPQVIIRLIEDYHLQDYTMIALGKAGAGEEKWAVNEDPAAIAVPQHAVKDEVAPPPPVVVKKVSYPQGEFKINDTRVVYVKSGISYLSIAQLYSISLKRLFEFNDMNEAEITSNDQLVYLQRKRKSGEQEFHIVQAGETLHDIAQEQAIRLESLLEYNQLSSGMKPAPGQQLYLRGKSPSRPLLASDELRQPQPALANVNKPAAVTDAASFAARPVAHTVRPKETIYSISKMHNVKIDDLVAWNNLGGYELRTGQQLKIYK